MRQRRVGHQQRGAAAQASLAAPDQPPAVNAVRQRAAVQAERGERHQLGRAQQAYGHGRPGQLPGLHQQRDLGGLAAEQRDRAAGEHQPEVARGAQRPEIRAKPAHASGHLGLLDGWRACEGARKTEEWR
jgi:hypothetical protein